MWSGACEWIFGFLGSLGGKILLVFLIGFAFFVLKLRLDTAQARLEQSRLEVSVLQAANQKNAAAVRELEETVKRQEDALLFYAKQQENALKKIKEKEILLQKAKDTESMLWKNAKIPPAVLEVLRGV